MRTHSLLAGFVILVLSGGLFGADYFLKELPRAQGVNTDQNTPTPAGSSSSSSSVESTASSAASSVAGESSSSSSRTVVKKGVSTKKHAGVDVQSVLNSLQLITQETNESGFLTFVTTGNAVVQTWVLLRNNDRAFLFSWIDNDEAKTIFASLKQALSEQFSGKMTGLVDETRTQENGPPVDILSFSDPTLSTEKIMFLRVRTRLYEIHVAKNGEEVLDALVKELSR